jgi:hypothetical protein
VTALLLLFGTALMAFGVTQEMPMANIWVVGLIAFLWGWMRILRRWPL